MKPAETIQIERKVGKYMRNRYAKTILALLLSIAMIVGLVPTTSAAELVETPAVTDVADGELTEIMPEPEEQPVSEDPVDPQTDQGALILEDDEATVSDKARTAGDAVTVIQSLDIVLDPLDTGLPFPNARTIIAKDGQGTEQNFGYESDQSRVMVTWLGGWGASPPRAGRYSATIRATCPPNMQFGDRIANAVSVSTAQDLTNNHEGLVANDFNFEVSYDPGNPSVLTISCSFDIKTKIKNVELYVPAPVVGAKVYEYPSEVTARDEQDREITGLNARLQWEYRTVQTFTVVDSGNHELSSQTYPAKKEVSLDNMDYREATFRDIETTYRDLSAYGAGAPTGEEAEGCRTQVVTQYFYYPVLTMGPPAGYSFPSNVSVSFFAGTKAAGTKAGEIPVVLNWIGTDGQVQVHPEHPAFPNGDKDQNGTPIFPNGEAITGAANLENWFKNYWVQTTSSNQINSVMITLPYTRAELQEGQSAPSTAQMIRDIRATLGSSAYFDLTITDAQWISGVSNNRFSAGGEMAVLQLRLGELTGFNYHDRPGVVVSSRNLSTGQNPTAVKQTDNTLLVTIQIVIDPATITSIGDFTVNDIVLQQNGADAPAVEQVINGALDNFVAPEIPYEYPAANKGTFLPMTARDEKAEKSRVTVTKSTGGSAGVIGFGDELTVRIELTQPKNCVFPVPFESPSIPGTYVEPDLKLPDGWTVKWFTDEVNFNKGTVNPENSAEQLVIYKTYKMPEAINGAKVKLADIVLGEALSAEAQVEGLSGQTSLPSGITGSVAWEPDGSTGLTSSVDSPLYGDRFTGTLTLSIDDTSMYAFDSKQLTASTVEFDWAGLQEAGLKVTKPHVTGCETVAAAPGPGTAVLTFTVQIPKGVITAFTVPSSDLQLIVDDPLNPLGANKGRPATVMMQGHADGEGPETGNAGLFATGAEGSVKWKILNAQFDEDKNSPIAVAGASYEGVVDVQLQDVDDSLSSGTRRYVFDAQASVEGETQKLIRAAYQAENGLKVQLGTPQNGAADVSLTQLKTRAKLPINTADIQIAPPLQELDLTKLNPQNGMPAEIQVDASVIFTAAANPNVNPPKGKVTLTNWGYNSRVDHSYTATITVDLGESYDDYVFRYMDDGKEFKQEDVAINVGQTVPATEFYVIDEEREALDMQLPAEQRANYEAGKQFVFTGYVVPAARGIEEVEVDIIPPWSLSKPEVHVKKTSDANDDYIVASNSETIRLEEERTGTAGTTYRGVLVLETTGEVGGMNGGAVFRSVATGQKWLESDYEKVIKLHGMNDSKVTVDFERARAESFQYDDNRLVIPFRIEYATQQIKDVALYVPRPIIGMDPLDHVDLGLAERTSRYRVTDTVWQRNANAEAEDPYVATVTIEANRLDPIREFDDEFYFDEPTWNRNWTPEELAEIVEPLRAGGNPDNPVQPQNAAVVDGKLILTLLVYPREAENEISRLEMNLGTPTLSGAQRGGETITQIVYYKESKPESVTDGTAIEAIIPADNITHASWVRQANGKYKTTYSIRPNSEYTFQIDGDAGNLLKINDGPIPRNITVTSAGTLTFEVECDLTDDIKLVIRTNPSGLDADVAETPDVRAAIKNSQGKVDLKVQPRNGYSLTGTSRDLQMDDRVRVASGSDIHLTAGRGYVYSLTVADSVTPQNKAYITVRFTPNDVVLPRADGITVTVNGSPYTMGSPIEEGSEVRLQLQSGYELRPGRVLELYNVLTDDKLEELKSTDGNRTFTFTMPDAPVEVYGRIVRPGEPDPDPTPRPSTRPSQDPLDPNDPSNPSNPDDPDDPTASPSPSGAPSPSGSPTTKPSSTPSGTLGQDDYVKYGSLEDLETIEGSQITLSGSGADKIIKGYQVKSGSSALARDLAGQYWLPDGLDIQIVDTKGKVLKSTDKVATGHTLQLVNSRKHVLDSAVISLKGDVTGSGVIGISQLVRLAKAVTYENPLKDPYFSAGDFNNNGRIDLGDMVQLATRIAQK